jgi:hypothetical protein
MQGGGEDARFPKAPRVEVGRVARAGRDPGDAVLQGPRHVWTAVAPGGNPHAGLLGVMPDRALPVGEPPGRHREVEEADGPPPGIAEVAVEAA